MDFLKNILVNLTATNLAAVAIAWLICFTIVALNASETPAQVALAVLAFFGVGLLQVLAQNPPD